ncbi:hypothetical protein D3C78_1218210 [compost metagenome]
MPGAHQGIDHSNAGARLTGAGSHHQQEITLLLRDPIKHRANRSDLIVAAGDRGVYELLRQRLAITTDVGKALQVVAGGKANHLTRWGVLQIPEIQIMAIGVEAER